MSTEQTQQAIEGLDKLYEFEREPVSENNLQPGRHFAGLFAGEHVAGTEFVIGALFVTWGASAYDIFVGLLIGNALAVLTWTLICAPIAVRTRLTLYWYLRKIAGPGVTLLANVLNAFLYCILAGCMITVSASAVRIPFGIAPQTHWYPDDWRFVVIVLLVGSVVVTLAILGFKKLAQFSTVCSPWMFLMFIGGGLVTLPGLAAATANVGEVRSFADFWTLATEQIWTGVAPDPANQMTFWHVAAFAWICNLAMHGGLSDMAIFRYARSSWYGLYSAFGMFLGHYLAWIFAGMMGASTAVALGVTMNQLDPGAVAQYALGVSGIIAVVLAGWTTSNPTIYRAGLALQAVTPGWPRWVVTLMAGAATTIIACFPFVFTKLLDFVGLYGLLLMPVGAIVFAEHWLFPLLGLKQYWAEKKQAYFSWPALASWIIAMLTALVLNWTGVLHLFFLFLPVWALTIVLYIVFAILAGAKDGAGDDGDAFTVPASEAAARVAPEPTAPTAPARKQTNVVLWVSGLVALGALLIIFILPICILFKGSEGYIERLATFQKILIWPTIAYFIAGTVWTTQRDKGTPAS